MNEIKIVTAIMGDEKTGYQVGQELHGHPGSVISSILLDGMKVEVFARESSTQECIRKSLLPPTVATLISLASKADLPEVLQAMTSPEKITSVQAADGKMWALDATVPGDTSTRIVRIRQDDEFVEIVAIPNLGHPLDVGGFFLIYTLMPMSFLSVSATSSVSDWIALQQEIAAAGDSDDEDEDEEDDEDTTDEEVNAPSLTTSPSLIPQVPQMMPQAPPPPPPPAELNGASASATTTE